MSDTGIAPGWYDDPDRPGTHRWWNGAAWTDVRHDPSVPVPRPQAPEGTRWNTVWIWLVVAVPLAGYIPLLFLDWSGFAAISVGAGSEETRRGFVGFIGWFMLIGAVQWVIYGLGVVFAWLDYRELRRRGVPRPFHWAWSFLYAIVYVIGRSIVVQRRTGRGYAPIWGQVAAVVLAIGVTVVMMIRMTTAILEAVPYSTTY